MKFIVEKKELENYGDEGIDRYAIEQERDVLIKLVQKVEWIKVWSAESNYSFCPYCHNSRSEGHSEICSASKYFKELE